jgi:hypothetical protein
MKCEEAGKFLPLFLYGELSFGEEERLEVHIDECATCRSALDRERALHKALNAGELLPSEELLGECRRELRRRVAHLEPPQAGFWSRLKEGFTIRIHPFAPAAQPLGAVALVALGFFAARVVPAEFGGRFGAAGLADPVTSRVRYVEPVGSGKIQIVIDETRQRVLSGSPEDQSIQRLLFAAAKDPSDPGLRVESVDILKSRPDSSEVRSALLYALQHDSNAGVRLKALDGLKNFGADPETRKVLTQVLLADKNPGVRTQVIDLLIQSKGDSMVGVLQELMRKEDNGYIRMRCQKALHELNASVDTF